MARQRTNGSVYRPSKGKGKVKGRFYWVRCYDEHGDPIRKPLKLPDGRGVTDKDVAEKLLRDMVTYSERKQVGLIDPAVENACIPMRTVLGRYVRYLRRRKRGRPHIKQVIACMKLIIDKTGMRRLADFNVVRIDRALGMVSEAGRSARTVNEYRKAAFGLARWAMRVAEIVDRNPCEAIEPRDERADRRKVRRALTLDEAGKLLAVSADRRLYYHVALWTGLRVNEVRLLEWRDLDLEGDRPCLVLRAATTKSKRADELPIHADLAVALRAARPAFAKPTDRVFRTVPIRRTLTGGRQRCKGGRRHYPGDLERAGIAVQDAHGRSVDLHALRTTYISWLGEHGVDPRAQVILARHTPQGVTLKHYQDFTVFDLWAEIAKLPGPPKETEAARATGTLDATAVGPGASFYSAPIGSDRRLLAKNGGSGLSESSAIVSSPTPSKHCKTRGLRAKTGLGDRGLEPLTSCVSSRRSGQLS